MSANEYQKNYTWTCPGGKRGIIMNHRIVSYYLRKLLG